MYGRIDSSWPQKFTILLLNTLFLVLALWLLTRGGQRFLQAGLGWHGRLGPRADLLAAAFIVLYLRLGLTVFWFVRRAIPWQEASFIPLAVAIYTIGFALMASTRALPPGAWDWFAAALFLAGSALNTCGEWGRHRFKSRGAHRGHLYTDGAFRFIRHPNYLGDVLWVAGIAILSGNPWAAIVPVVLLAFFAFGNAPMLDRHLAEHYGDEFKQWHDRSWSLIPFVY